MMPATGAGALPGGAPDVSIIITHYRSPEFLEKCLRTIVAVRPAVAYEILIVDNAPLDERASDLAELYGARHLRSARNVGYGRAINFGMTEARGRHFLILNPDIEVRPGSIEALVAFMDDHPEVGIAGPKLYSLDGSLQYSARTNYTLPIILLRRTPLGRLFPNARAVRDHLMMDWDHNDARDVDWLLGGAIIARRAAVDEVGPMDARYFLYFEDVDWCERMRGRGWRVVYVPQAEMTHAHQRMSASGFLGPAQRMHLESALRFYEKWSTVLYLWKRHARSLRRLVTLGLDIILLSAAFLAAYFTRTVLGLLIPRWADARPLLALDVYWRFLIFADLVAITIFAFLRLYRSEIWHDRWREFTQLVKGVGLTSLVVLATTFLFTRRPMSRFTIVLFFPYALLLVGLGRAMLRGVVAGARGRNLYLRRLAVFGPETRLAETRTRFARHGTFGYEPIFLAHEDERTRSHPAAADPVERRLRLLVHERIAEVVLFDSGMDADLVRRLLPKLLRTGLPVRYVPETERWLHGARQVDDFMGFMTIAMGGRPSVMDDWRKRAVDRIVAAALLLLGLPFHLLQLIVAGRPPVIRVPIRGRGGRTVLLRFYRKPIAFARLPGFRWYPALLNVLSGEVSLVGTIPIGPFEFGDDPAASLDCAPGLIAPRPAGLDPLACARLPEDGGPDPVVYQEALARNRRYLEGWSSAEDLRLVYQSVFRGSQDRAGRQV